MFLYVRDMVSYLDLFTSLRFSDPRSLYVGALGRAVSDPVSGDSLHCQDNFS